MTIFGGSSKRVEQGPVSLRKEAEDIIDRWLTPSLIETLRGLRCAPTAVANATIQLLDFGSRAALRKLALTAPPAGVSDEGRTDEQKRRDPVVLTPLAYEVMDRLNQREKANPAGVQELADMISNAASDARALH